MQRQATEGGNRRKITRKITSAREERNRRAAAPNIGVNKENQAVPVSQFRTVNLAQPLKYASVSHALRRIRHTLIYFPMISDAMRFLPDVRTYGAKTMEWEEENFSTQLYTTKTEREREGERVEE